MLEAIFFGVIQGLTEFLPISSSAHIRIFAEFFGMTEDPEQGLLRLCRSEPSSQS